MIKKEDIEQAVADGLVSVQKHPTEEYYIYNYTQKVQYERLWDDITVQCRGLILDENYNIVAKPFSKFFNLGEHTDDEIPNHLPFEVFDKLDGSLGILYWIGDTPHIASRGSFTSDQAVHATKVLHENYQDIFHLIDKDRTYLFEILYPENRIVLDYGDLDDIILLTSINNKTGEEEVHNIGFPVVGRKHNVRTIEELKGYQEDNKEGFVVRFSNGFRIKIKFDEYVRLHRIITEVSSKIIWEHLRAGLDFDEMLERVPDEFFDWVKKTRNQLTNEFEQIKDQVIQSFGHNIIEDTKEFALWAKKQEYPHLLFGIRNGKDIDDMIYKMIKPRYQKPFWNECKKLGV